MFDTVMIGRRVAQLRKEKNMTQMELADRMGVSYQAVSNWERGNSMPDISKLGDLSEILGISIDELLGKEDIRRTNLVKHMLHDEDPSAFVKEEEIHLKDVAEIAPALKPEQAEKLAKAAWEAREMAWEKTADTAEREETRFERTAGSIEKEEALFEKPGDQQEREKTGRKRYVKDKGTDLRDIEALAPFLRGEFLDSLVVEAAGEGISCEDLCSLAPFLSRDTVAALLEKAEEACNLEQLCGLAPFAGREAVSRMFSRIMEKEDFSMEELCALAPFTERHLLSEAARRISDTAGFEELSGLAPFIDREVLKELFRKAAEREDVSAEALCALTPFVGREEISAALRRLSGNISLQDLCGLAPFADRETLDALFSEAVEKEKPCLEDLTALAPFVGRESLSRAAEKLSEKVGLGQLCGLAPFIDREILRNLAKKAVEADGDVTEAAGVLQFLL